MGMMRFVDLFAGWGGFSLAAEMAGGHVVEASNHWPLAVEAHAANHPKTHHVCQDVRMADWATLPSYDVLLASPECRGHSQAAQPNRKRTAAVRKRHDALRSTAWAVTDCAEITRPAAIIVENVPDFQHWTSDPDDPEKRGDMFRLWCMTLETLGYRLQVGELIASVHANVPQRRKRLFVVGIRDNDSGGRSRGPRPGEGSILRVPPSPEPAFRPCVDWGAGRWKRVADSTPGVRERVARSRARLGVDRFLTQHTSDHWGTSLDEPIRTITTKDQWALVDGDKYRPLTVRESARGMGFPDSYRWPERARRGDTIAGLGNAVPPDLGRVVISRTCGVL